MNGTVMGPVVTPPESNAHGQERVGHERRQSEYHNVEADEQPRKVPSEQDAQERHHQEEPHAGGHREDEHAVRHRGRLAGQYLQVRLGHGDDHADNKAGCNDEPQPF